MVRCKRRTFFYKTLYNKGYFLYPLSILFRMSVSSKILERILRISGANKRVSERKFYKKLRQNAIRYKKGEKRLFFFSGVRVHREVYCGMPYYVFVPHSVETEKSIMYLHGSGFMNSFRRCQARFAADLAFNTHAKVYFPLYPKLPISTILPCFALLHNFYIFLLKKGDVLLCGDSSGAMLALALASERKEAGFVAAISPWVSLSVGEECRKIRTDAMLSVSVLDRVARLWAYDLAYDSPKLSPINGEYAGKRLLVFSGEKEIFRPDILRFVRETSEKGASVVYYEGAGQQHCYPLWPTPEGKEARRELYRNMQSLIYGVKK